MLSQRETLELCGGWTHGRLKANNQTRIIFSLALCKNGEKKDSAAEISVKVHFVTG